MRSPRFSPAGLLVRLAGRRGQQGMRIAIDGGGSPPLAGGLDAWLVTDEKAELIAAIRACARELGLEPGVAAIRRGGIAIVPRRVRHTSHPTYAYEITWRGRRVIWAPETAEVPNWVAGADLLFADAAGWSRPIRFRGGVGGHTATLAVAARARRLGVGALVFAHIGRPTIRAMDAGLRASFGRFGRDGQSFRLRAATRRRSRPERPSGSFARPVAA